MTLSPEARERLLAEPMHQQAVLLLTGAVGPLDQRLAYSAEAIALATCLHLIWRAARTTGSLRGIPSWEAAERLNARARSARHAAGTLDDYRTRVCRGLGVRPEGWSEGNVLWWRSACAELRWADCKRREVVQDAIEARGLLNEWLWALTRTDDDRS